MSIFTRVLALFSATAFASAAQAAVPPVILARFAVIYPEAELAEENDEMTPEVASLPQPAKKPAKTNTQTSAKKGKTAVAKPSKPLATVAPLRRDRPKSEVDPPKTRRRQLGW